MSDLPEEIIEIDYDYILALKPEDQEEFIRMISKPLNTNIKQVYVINDSEY